MSSLKENVLQIISKVPFGKIASYGDIAAWAGTNPRVVGFILNAFTKEEADKYPWQRIVNRNGFISASKFGNGERGIIQQLMLEKEGIVVKDFQIIEPNRYWYKLLIHND